MNKKFTLFFFFFLGLFSINAQDIVQISVGAGYANQVYYSLSDDNIVTLENDSWDLAFSTNPSGGGILYNESATLSAENVLELYLAPTDNFTDIIDPTTLSILLYNGAASWEEGAFNTAATEGDPFDFGWGTYNSNTHVVEGTRVYAFKLRDGNWKKLQMGSLSGGVYSMKTADLDNANEEMITINKSDFTGSDLALYSFSTGEATASPAGWNLYYGRYLYPLDSGDGEILEYNVTGILSGPGVEIAEARNIDPKTVNQELYLDSLDSHLDIIGHDWKNFDLSNFSWALDESRAYFIKLSDNELWRINFIDFEGSSTGTATFEKTNLGQLTAVTETESNFLNYGVFPNPIEDEFNLSFSLKERQTDMPVYLVNTLGQRVWQKKVNADAGLNVLNFYAPSIPSGVYHLVIGQGGDVKAISTFFK